MIPIYVTGHKNPDTDSIVSAMAYAALKNALGEREYIPARLGRISDETQSVLNRFSCEPPMLIKDVRTQVSDLSYDTPPVLSSAVSVAHAWTLLKNREKVPALPVIDDDNSLFGMLSTGYIAEHDIQYAENPIIDDVPLFNLVAALDGKVIDGIGTADNITGDVKIALPNKASEYIFDEKSIVITADSTDVIISALKANCPCVVLCESALDEECRKYAEENKCKTVFIITPYEPYRAARMIFLSIPISRICRTDDLCPFHLSDYIDDVRNTVLATRHRSYPILDDNDRVCGTLSRFHLLRPKRKKVVLVDHNEVSQSVPGLDQAEIIAIVDHHRLGDVQTSSPVNVRNETVGSTSTIVSTMYMENGIQPTAKIAGLLCCAILSDTVMFKSPTCTQRDIDMANRMAKIASVTIEEMGRVLYSSSLDKDVSDILKTDFKQFLIAGHSMGISQTVTMDADKLIERKEEFLKQMEKEKKNKEYDLFIYVITDMLKEGSYILFVGDDDIISQAFSCHPKEKQAFLPGVISRKKQIVPSLSLLWG